MDETEEYPTAEPEPDKEKRQIAFFKRLSQEGGKRRLREIEALSELIGELKKTQKKLEKSRRYMSEIIDFLPDATFVIDKTGKVTAWNRAMETLTGTKAEEMIGRGGHEYALPFYGVKRPMLIDLVLMPDGTVNNHYGDFGEISSQESVLTAERYFPEIHGGKGAYLLTRARILRDIDGGVAGAIETIHDITKRRQTEQALRESEVRYRNIFENTGTGMLIVEDDMTISFASTKLEGMIGYKRREIEGKRKWTDFVHPDDLEWMIEQHARRRSNPELARKNYEFRVIHGDGQILDMYLNVDMIPGTRKSVVSLIDISERKRAEKKQRDLEKRLQRSEKMEALGLLSGGVAHDLNNVLGILLGYSELLTFHIDETSPLRPQVMNILAAGKRAAAIVDDMLTLARRGVQSREVLRLNTLVRDFLGTPECKGILAFHPGVRIAIDLDEALPHIMGSPHHIGKAMVNLVSNAAEAMPGGGVVTIATANRYMDRPVQGYDEMAEGDYAILTVSDTGEGISPRDMARIFEPFYTKKVMGRSGTGLGLSLVWGTLKDHNGYIDVQSAEGNGTVFTLYFPATREEPASAHAPLPMADYAGAGETILVVDDVQEQRELASRILERLNYRVVTAPSGEEACTYLLDHRVDLVLLDMIMESGMDGLDTYRRILEIHPGQKAIIVSGFSETDRVGQARGLGAGAYVKKPYTSRI
ncbi:MAG: PAS domain S-box protein [Syntrophales bacterium]